MVLDGKFSQEYPVHARVLQRFALCPTLFLLHINDLTEHVICNIAIFADDAYQASDLWQQLELAVEVKSDLQDIADWSKNWLVDLNA